MSEAHEIATSVLDDPYGLPGAAAGGAGSSADTADRSALDPSRLRNGATPLDDVHRPNARAIADEVLGVVPGEIVTGP